MGALGVVEEEPIGEFPVEVLEVGKNQLFVTWSLYLRMSQRSSASFGIIPRRCPKAATR
jgi:hypothetical protein